MLLTFDDVTKSLAIAEPMHLRHFACGPRCLLDRVRVNKVATGIARYGLTRPTRGDAKEMERSSAASAPRSGSICCAARFQDRDDPEGFIGGEHQP